MPTLFILAYYLIVSFLFSILQRRIITSILDLDMYKLTMMQVNWLKHRNVLVKYGFQNRNKKWRLADKIPFHVLRRELDAISNLKFTKKEIDYLGTLKDRTGRLIFRKDFLQSLLGFEVPEIKLSILDGQFVIECEGQWHLAIIVETMVMSVMTELNGRYERKRLGLSLWKIWLSGNKKLSEKIAILKKYPAIIISDFGTRRRFSKLWQEYVLLRLKHEIGKQLHSTSNLYFGMKFGILVVGTAAHEQDMTYAALYGRTKQGLIDSHQKFLEDWWEIYGEGLSVALTDTFTSEFFYSNFTKEQAEKWWGYRPDSGDPFHNGYRLIKFLLEKGIDPTTKMILFSDDLNIEKIIALYLEFKDKIDPRFGWGTGLTNDMGIEEATFSLKIVMKAIAARWNEFEKWVGTVKLSDDEGKHTGSDEDINLYLSTFTQRELA